MWKQKNVAIDPYAVITFTRSDGQLQVNNGITLMRMTLTHNDFDSVSIVNDSNGANVTNLPVGDYSVYLTLPCGIRLDRDWNAALNTLDAAGLAESLNARGGDVRRRLAQTGRNADAREAGTRRTARLH